MADNIEGTRFLDKKNNVMLVSASLLTIGLIAGGYLLGDGLLRSKMADRSVTVRGLAEREVTADLATWTIAYSAQSSNLAAAQADIDQDTAAIGKFFTELGFKADALKPTGANVNQYSNNGIPQYTIRQRLSLRTNDIDKAQAAVARQFDLVRRGVVLEDGSGMSYTFTKLDEIKPEMVAAATKDARKSAEQFAKDSGTDVGGIKSATQGYFSINSRDGDGGGYGVTDTPYKKVRVVTTVNFYLD
ncbi:MAG: SIMPL domain-containing protein [Parasphingorhabdus sp.]|uniref:SIMPL domain-containing protein n=1 Tax=Parasphingorhabdus sp. TaxID=2709688 RepID=UPI0030027778